MTQVIIQDETPRTQLTSAAGQTVFNTLWTADAASDVLVYARGASVEPDDTTQLVSDTLYNVTFIGASQTVRVTFLSGRTLDDIITIVRDTPAERTNLYINTNFTPSMLNQDFGILTLVDQQSQMYDTVVNPGYNISATIDPVIDTVLPILAANQIWAMNPTRTAIIPFNVPSGGGLAPDNGPYLIRTADSDLPNAQIMGNLASGIVINTNNTGTQLTRILTGTTEQIAITNGDGILGNPTASIVDNPVISGKEGLGLPQGTTAERPLSPNGTEFRFNTTITQLEYWDGAMWIQLSESEGVESIEGTEFQVLVNGGFGTPVQGNIVLTLPQNIATTSTPTFDSLILTNPLSTASGGLGINTTPANGQVPIGNGAGYTIANLTAGPGISINNTSGAITISGTGSGTGFTLVTGTSQAMVADSGYVTNNAGLVTLTLPATAAFGSAQTIVGLGAGGWLIAQNSGQRIQVGNQTTTTGTGGSLASTNRYDSIDILCVVANTTWVAWGAPQSAGLTFV